MSCVMAGCVCVCDMMCVMCDGCVCVCYMHTYMSENICVQVHDCEMWLRVYLTAAPSASVVGSCWGGGETMTLAAEFKAFCQVDVAIAFETAL